MLLKNGKILNNDFDFQNADLLISDKIVKISENIDSSEEVIDISGLTVLPGLIDIHTHGSDSFDTMDATYEAINTISEFMAKNGVTSFLPTTMTESAQSIENALLNIKSAIDKGVKGADVVGVHMEGPYFSAKYKGAQNEKYLKAPSAKETLELQGKSGNLIKIISIAPEKEGAMEFIKEVSNKGIVVSLGHTESDYDTAAKAIENGATHVTHLFNAMSPFTHRHPGVIGAAFDKDLSVEVICDGIHLHPAVIRTVHKVVNSDKLVLISDSLRATGLSDGTYELGGQTFYVNDGVARIEGGNLAGSTTPLFNCLKKAVEFGIPFKDAIKAVTINPAKAIRVDDRIGSIVEGKDADFVIINDKLEIVHVILKGKLLR